MNDIEKAFEYQTVGLKEVRARANRHLPTLQKIVEETKDGAFVGFVQDITDNYMANVCKLGRRGK